MHLGCQCKLFDFSGRIFKALSKQIQDLKSQSKACLKPKLEWKAFLKPQEVDGRHTCPDDLIGFWWYQRFLYDLLGDF